MRPGDEGVARLREIVEPVVRDNFLELFDLSFARRGGRWVVTVVLDRGDGAVSLADCEQVSRDLEKRLDALDLVEGPWVLEVSSPGLDRPLRSPADCRRFEGKSARFVLRRSGPAGPVVTGRLAGVEGNTVRLALPEGGAVEVDFDDVKEARLEVEF